MYIEGLQLGILNKWAGQTNKKEGRLEKHLKEVAEKKLQKRIKKEAQKTVKVVKRNWKLPDDSFGD